MTICKRLCYAAIALCVLLLAACTDNPIYKEANDNTAKVQKQIQDIKVQDLKYTKPQKVSVYNKVYVDNKPFVIQPRWMKAHVQLTGTIPFRQAVKLLVKGSNISVAYANGVKLDKKIKINFSGKVSNALNLLQVKSGYHYTINNGVLTWASVVTRTFQISLMPGKNTFDLGKSSGPEGSDSNQKDHSSDANSQYSTLSGSLSIWQDINKEIPNLLSKHGTYTVSQANSSITVTDSWKNVKAVSEWVKDLNNSLSKQVSIRVQILQVQLSKQFERGVNWSLVSKYVTAGLGGNIFSSLALGTITGNSSDVSFTGTVGSGSLSGSKMLITALSTQGKLSITNNPLITTLNNQVAEIQQVIDTGYLKQMSVTSSSGFYSSPEVSLTPGNIKTGLQLYVLPKIQGNKIFLQISANLSKLTNLQNYQPDVGNGQGGSGGGSISYNPSNGKISAGGQSGGSMVSSSIQLPTVESKKFNQRSVLKNGQTLIIAGFNGSTNQTKRAKYFDLPFTGGASGLSDKTETILLITPRIIQK